MERSAAETLASDTLIIFNVFRAATAIHVIGLDHARWNEVNISLVGIYAEM